MHSVQWRSAQVVPSQQNAVPSPWSYKVSPRLQDTQFTEVVSHSAQFSSQTSQLPVQMHCTLTREVSLGISIPYEPSSKKEPLSHTEHTSGALHAAHRVSTHGSQVPSTMHVSKVNHAPLQSIPSNALLSAHSTHSELVHLAQRGSMVEQYAGITK